VEQTVEIAVSTSVAMDTAFKTDVTGQVVLANAQTIVTLNQIAGQLCPTGDICLAGGALPTGKTCCVQLAECASLTVDGTATAGKCATTSPAKEMGLLTVSRRRRMESSKRRLATVPVNYKAKGETTVTDVPSAVANKVTLFNDALKTDAAKKTFSDMVVATVSKIVNKESLQIGSSAAAATALATAAKGGASDVELAATNVVNATSALSFTPTATVQKKSAGSTSSAAGAIVSGLTVLAAAFFTL